MTEAYEYKLENFSASELPRFVHSSSVTTLADSFDTPHRAVDYLESVNVTIPLADGSKKSINTRQYYVSSLTEKSKYPSALIVLMEKLQELEKQVVEKGKKVEVPAESLRCTE